MTLSGVTLSLAGQEWAEGRSGALSNSSGQSPCCRDTFSLMLPMAQSYGLKSDSGNERHLRLLYLFSSDDVHSRFAPFASQWRGFCQSPALPAQLRHSCPHSPGVSLQPRAHSCHPTGVKHSHQSSGAGLDWGRAWLYTKSVTPNLATSSALNQALLSWFCSAARGIIQ